MVIINFKTLLYRILSGRCWSAVIILLILSEWNKTMRAMLIILRWIRLYEGKICTIIFYCAFSLHWGTALNVLAGFCKWRLPSENQLICSKGLVIDLHCGWLGCITSLIGFRCPCELVVRRSRSLYLCLSFDESFPFFQHSRCIEDLHCAWLAVFQFKNSSLWNLCRSILEKSLNLDCSYKLVYFQRELGPFWH